MEYILFFHNVQNLPLIVILSTTAHWDTISIKRVCKLWFPEDLLGCTECPEKNDTNKSEFYNIQITHLFQKYNTILEFAIRHACTINTL